MVTGGREIAALPVAQERALLIGMLGPILQAVGVAWDLLQHAVLDHGEVHEATMRHILFGGPHLVIFAGFTLSLICIPLAIEVALALPEELEQPDFERVGQGALSVATAPEAGQ